MKSVGRLRTFLRDRSRQWLAAGGINTAGCLDCYFFIESIWLRMSVTLIMPFGPFFILSYMAV